MCELIVVMLKILLPRHPCVHVQIKIHKARCQIGLNIKLLRVLRVREVVNHQLCSILHYTRFLALPHDALVHSAVLPSQVVRLSVRPSVPSVTLL